MKVEKITITYDTLKMLEAVVDVSYDNWSEALDLYPDDEFDITSNDFKALFSLIEKLNSFESVTLEVSK